MSELKIEADSFFLDQKKTELDYYFDGKEYNNI
jgi:hypothetical protein